MRAGHAYTGWHHLLPLSNFFSLYCQTLATAYLSSIQPYPKLGQGVVFLCRNPWQYYGPWSPLLLHINLYMIMWGPACSLNSHFSMPCTNWYVCCITFKKKSRYSDVHGMLKYCIWCIGGIMRILEICTLPENLSGLVLIFKAITFANVFLIPYPISTQSPFLSSGFLKYKIT